MKRTIELLAPAGSFESIEAACACGADAVYIGGESFSARAGAVNFTHEQMKEAADYCHLRGVQVHRAMNTVIFDSEMEEFVREAAFSAEIGIDALIIQDWGAARAVHRAIPEMPLHASTQMTIHTPQGALMAAELGFSRVVPARELSAEKIAEICKTGIETEAFVHGALCMCVSGQCYMSAVIGSRSANRGQCAQACRLPFNALGNKEERHDLSLKDMSHILSIEELARCGVASLKIEGRMKRAEYVAAAVTACRRAIDGLEPDMDSLRAVFSRSGFTDGYIKGKTGAEMFGFRRKDNVEAAAGVLPAMRELYRSEKPRYTADMDIKIREGVPAELTACCEGVSAHTRGAVPSVAVNRPTDAAAAEKQLSRLGGTVFSAGNITADIDEGLMLPAAALNGMRRDAVSELERLIIEKNTPRYAHIGDHAEDFGDIYREPCRIQNRFFVHKREQLPAALQFADYAIIPLDECPAGEYNGKEADKDCFPDEQAIKRVIIAPPRFMTDEEDIKRQLAEKRSIGFKELYCGNIAHIKLGRELGFTLHGGYGLNITNSYSVSAMKDMGLTDITASFEMKLHDISALADIIDIAAVVYGRLPLMLVRNCPVRQAAGCGRCTGRLTDRTGRTFSVRCSGDKAYSEIFNCDILYMGDRLNEIHGVRYFDSLFTDETPSEIAAAAENMKNASKPQKGFTRGLYYRGII